MAEKRLEDQMKFLLEIDKEKNILRQTHLSGHGRRENDAEHAWHMAIMIYLLREYANDLYSHKKMKTNPENSLEALQMVIPVFEAMTEWTFDSVHDALINLAAEKELKNGRIMWPVRVAASGKPTTPGGAVEICQILGKEETLRRLRLGVEQLTP